MTDRDTADDGTDEQQGFVFGESRAEGTDAAASSAVERREQPEDSTAESGSRTSTLTMAVVGACAALILLVAGVQLFAPGALGDVLDGGGSGAPVTTTGTTPADATASPTATPDGGVAGTARDTDAADNTEAPGDGGPNTDSATTDTDGGGGMATPPNAGTSPAGGTSTTAGSNAAGPTTGGDGDGGAGEGTGTGGGFVQNGDGDNRPPTIQSMSVVDDSQTGASGGTLVFEVGWTVTDPDGNLREVQVTVLGDSGGQTTTLVRRPIPVDGGQNQSTTTFEIPLDEPLGEPYEIRLVAEDQFGNAVNETRREVADGEGN